MTDQTIKGDPNVDALMNAVGRVIVADYTNWRAERATRRIHVHDVRWSASTHHPKEQWLLEGTDVERGARRLFAVDMIHGWAFA